MQKPLKSRGLRNRNHNIFQRRKRAAGVSSGGLFVLSDSLFGGNFRAVLTSADVSIRAPVAQRIEHLPSKQRAAGSSPAGGTISVLPEKQH